MAAPSGTQKPTLPADAGTGSGTKVEKLPSVPGTSQLADGAGGGGSEEPPHVLDVDRLRRLNAFIHREKVGVDELQRLVGLDDRVNLMNDPLLSFVIACKKPKLAVLLIAKISDDRLEDSNYDGDTALHVAAAMDDKEVARELIRRVPNLVDVRNRTREIPLHKAALYGRRKMFWLLVAKASSPDARREDGASMLHCAIMGNAPALALEIAKKCPRLITSVDVHGVTSLDLMLTNPELFRSQTVLGLIQSFLYDLIPLEEDRGKTDDKDAAQEAATSSNDIVSDAQQRDHESLERPRGICSRFLPHYATLIDPSELIRMIAIWILFPVVKLFHRTIERLKEAKRRHKAALELIVCFANLEPEKTMTPLIKAVEKGLHEFVDTILWVCPQSATYRDANGRDVLQVAVMYRRDEIVNLIWDMRTMLPSWLFSRVDPSTGNTILHLASGESPDAVKEEQIL